MLTRRAFIISKTFSDNTITTVVLIKTTSVDTHTRTSLYKTFWDNTHIPTLSKKKTSVKKQREPAGLAPKRTPSKWLPRRRSPPKTSPRSPPIPPRKRSPPLTASEPPPLEVRATTKTSKRSTMTARDSPTTITRTPTTTARASDKSTTTTTNGNSRATSSPTTSSFSTPRNPPPGRPKPAGRPRLPRNSATAGTFSMTLSTTTMPTGHSMTTMPTSRPWKNSSPKKTPNRQPSPRTPTPSCSSTEKTHTRNEKWD
mmetsp:Transcript_78603/g.159585  ORF Transcript_78603/g.159585 Transcript_78603/m.159585 type:complete len:256 (-) Transcript_78603:676-1443(-)